MTDNELRGVILRQFYDLRKDNGIHRLKYEDLNGVEKNDYNRIGRQLESHGLIDWWQPISGSGNGRITARGVDVIEGVTKAPISINLNDHSVAIHGSQNVQIGNSNSINASTDIDVQKILSAIDRSPASEAEKQEAKGLFTKLTNNATFASIVTAIIGMGTGSAS